MAANSATGYQSMASGSRSVSHSGSGWPAWSKEVAATTKSSHGSTPASTSAA